MFVSGMYLQLQILFLVDEELVFKVLVLEGMVLHLFFQFFNYDAILLYFRL